MARLKSIAQLGERILRQPSRTIAPHDISTVKPLLEDMLRTLDESRGVGLAAPQVYESIRVIIVASRPTARYPRAPTMPATIMINPEFTILSDHIEKDWEGCLSVPGIRALVPRYQNIGVTYTDKTGMTQQTQLEGFVARIFQHEVDHLDGMIYLDRVENNRDIISEAEFFKLPTT
jgi:peptide deformylase